MMWNSPCEQLLLKVLVFDVMGNLLEMLPQGFDLPSLIRVYNWHFALQSCGGKLTQQKAEVGEDSMIMLLFEN